MKKTKTSWAMITFALFLVVGCSKDDDPKKLTPAKFSVDQNSINFAEVEIGALKNVKVTVTNTGEQDLILKDFTLSGTHSSEFSVNAGETEETVQPDGTYEFVVSFAPTEEGSKTATLTITSNVGEHPINLSGSASGGASAIVNIPDASFKAGLLAHGDTVVGENIGKIDTNDDGEIQVSEAESYSGTLLCYETNIIDLTGIEAFINVTVLIIEDTPLTSVDLSSNTALVRLEMDNNELTSLDVSKNVALERLECGYNQLVDLDVSHNTALKYLGCDNNAINDLDISQNTSLEQLNCSNNKLSSLNLSENTALTYLNCRINQLTQLDVSQNTSLQLLWANDNQLSNLDVSQNLALKELRCSINQLTQLDVSKNTALEKLLCEENLLTTLDVSTNVDLKELFCNDNELTSLDVSTNTALAFLSCNFNQLSNLDVSQNTVLEYLACTNNLLSHVDVSGNAALTSLFCFNNQLNALNVANGNNPSMAYMKAENNPGLTCIKIDGEGFTPPSSWSKDDTAGYATDCP